MQNKWIQILVVLAVLIGAGELSRFPEQRLTADLKEAGFIQERLSQEDSLKLGQTGAAVVLGGLRSLVATFMNLQAFAEFEVQDWGELERIYDIIVTLQPNNTYYWETGAWHLAYNAYADYADKIGMAAPRRRLKQKEFLVKGEQMLLRGVEQNPENIQLWQALGRMFADAHKPYDFEKASRYFERAVHIPGVKPRTVREYFYILGRTKGREQDAFQLGVQLMQDPQNNRFSSMRSLFLALSIIQQPDLADDNRLIDALWHQQRKAAYRDIVNYWCRTERERFPQATIDQVIKRLAQELEIADEYNPFKNPELRRIQHPIE